ncbi:hypothetical protein AVEN_209288-1 [Araneus ventricosus]|uniref:Uncharacterized protein n=1 Tax=Araneus ventricosus TaxID=182803 RepID=A0A4Y2CB34_ARAVE|nr:hypothetical protein AVEN_209288-1 [Araneus ventricosus]
MRASCQGQIDDLIILPQVLFTVFFLKNMNMFVVLLYNLLELLDPLSLPSHVARRETYRKYFNKVTDKRDVDSERHTEGGRGTFKATKTRD